MSARSVCKDTRPSRIHVWRAISDPYSRPLHITLTPLRAGAHRPLHSPFHRPGRGNTSLQLGCDVLRHQLGSQFWLLHLLHVYVYSLLKTFFLLQCQFMLVDDRLSSNLA